MFKIKKIYTKEEYVKKVLKDFPEYFKKDFLHVGHCFTDTNDQYTHILIDHDDTMYKVGAKYMQKNNPKVDKK
jgi:hypothetical protein